MFEISDNLSISILLYLAICYGLYEYKHPKMFKDNGEFKSFGLNKDETIFPYWLVTTILGLFVYYLSVIKGEENYL